MTKRKKKVVGAKAGTQDRAEAWQMRKLVALALPAKFTPHHVSEPESYPVLPTAMLTPFGIIPVVTSSRHIRPLAA